MAVETVEVAPVCEVPDNGYRSACGLWMPYPEIGDSLHHAEHAFADEWVLQQPFRCAAIDSETEEKQMNQGHHRR